MCFVCHLVKSIIHVSHAAKLVGKKGLSAEFPDGTPQMLHCPTNPPAKELTPNPQIRDDFQQCPTLTSPGMGRRNSALTDSQLHVTQAAQNPSGREWGHLHFTPPLFQCGAELQGTARQSSTSRSTETSPCSHSQEAFLVSHTLSDWWWQKWMWGGVVRIWWFKWKTLQGRRKCSNDNKAHFTHAL